MLYLDTSALVKLVFAEAESTVLARLVGDRDVAVSSLSRTELARVALRLDRRYITACHELIESCYELRLEPALLDRAGVAEPAALRSLDAIHLTSALTLGNSLESFVAYDARLLEAAAGASLPCLSPA
ncbi:MAG TPA: type II toxin-antitoxin system VapC family toxin [Nocardioidaceae bacterium]|jgi:predicted nucleic acid-binding protein